jgi:hypothetical protein
VSVTVLSSKPVRIRTQGGATHQLLVTGPDGATVFDSLPADAKATGVATAAVDSMVETAEDGSSSKTYDFSIDEPGRYTLSARTFGPKVNLPPVQFTVP